MKVQLQEAYYMIFGDSSGGVWYSNIAGESIYCYTKAWSPVTAEGSVVPVCESICYTETWSWVISVQFIVVKHMLHKSLVSGDSWAFSGSRGQAVLCVKAYAVQKSNLWLLQYNVPCPVYCVIAYMLHKSMVSCDSRAFSGSRGQVVSCRKVLHWENPPLAYSLWCGCRVPCMYIHQQTKPFPTNPDLLSSSPNSGWGRNILYKQCHVQIPLSQSCSWESSEHAQLCVLNL